MGELTATLTEKEWDYIGTVLAQRPYGEVAALILKLNEQFRQENQRKEPAQ